MINSLKKNKKGIFLMILSSICVCVGQLFWKIGLSDKLYILIWGFVLYGIGAGIMIIAYRFGSLSVLQPMISLNYIFTIFIGNIILNEPITINKLVGVFIITGGLILVGAGDE